MRTWLTRGATLAAVHAVAAVTVAAAKATDPTGWTALSAVVLGVLVAAAAVWAAVDAWRGLPDRGRTWVAAALVAGWGSAVLGVIGRGLFVDQTGPSALGQALTGGAAFTALLVLVPAALGLVVGPHLDGRRPAVSPPDGDPGSASAPEARTGTSRSPSPRPRRIRPTPSPRPRRARSD
ncbi:B-4DMT family transporter [Actinokineospora diospyrosa]|uniref:Uncharacterized protein n=1 Tax=Actinokineospora diospyrosa TaxID=103728 RepID=A0ABT1IM11_9PSEU|nr:B-4DMT family transporter [Actinokineospora diospyrosa]MCP2273692.1 hypothetical protein [Actinokineospora diospyrosa]